MFILNLTYTAPLDRVDALRPAHVDWLKGGAAAGHLVGWGRKIPAEGGVILATGERAAVEAFAQTDPYFVNGVARFEVIEFAPSFLAPDLPALAT